MPKRFPIVGYLAFMLVLSVHAEHVEPWQRHTIDNSSKGADGVRLADANGDGDLDVLTCQEADNLGGIWYENPYGKPEPIKP